MALPTPIDLRSDTVTRPTTGMLQAMLRAPVGDDVFGEDPSVNRLQDELAQRFGHEAGLFCPSGTMTNQIAIAVHTRPGDEVICHEQSHVYNYECGGIARHSHASTKLVRNDRSTMTPAEVDALVNADYDWLARTSLVVAEDTSNRGGGKCYTLHELQALSAYCQQKGLALHLDGARAFNAIIKQGHDPTAYGRLFHSVSICLSKGLGAPAGSVLLGSKAFIKEARRVRKVMGGGMRQAGYLAAAGIYALEHQVDRLAKDHIRAAQLAEALGTLPWVQYCIPPETNIVVFDVKPEPGSEAVLKALESQGIRAIAFGVNRIRMVTHLDVDDAMIERTISVLKALCF
jgi:threonine aldolase